MHQRISTLIRVTQARRPRLGWRKCASNWIIGSKAIDKEISLVERVNAVILSSKSPKQPASQGAALKQQVEKKKNELFK